MTHAVDATTLKKKMAETEGGKRGNLLKKFQKLTIENKLRKKKNNIFFDRKKKCRERAKKELNFEAVVFNFQKNMPVPNISNKNVCCKRHLSAFLSNVHVLSTEESIFYGYDHTIGGGADDVVSMMHYFVISVLGKIRTLQCLHYIVYKCRRLDSVTVTFPERGYSYVECDRNMAPIPKKVISEVPSDLYEIIENARIKSSPFKVVQ